MGDGERRALLVAVILGGSVAALAAGCGTPFTASVSSTGTTTGTGTGITAGSGTTAGAGGASSGTASTTAGSGGAGGNGVSATGTGGTTTSTSTSGAGGATTSTTSSSTTSTSGAGGAPPIECVWGSGNLPCPDGTYCASPTCSAGICEPIPDPSTEQPGLDQRVCGCDNITYWNATYAASHGVPVSPQGMNGQCSPIDFKTVKCDPDQDNCPKGASCTQPVSQQGFCNIAGNMGVCWVVPADCSGTNAKGKLCSGGDCADACSAVKNGGPWYKCN